MLRSTGLSTLLVAGLAIFAAACPAGSARQARPGMPPSEEEASQGGDPSQTAVNRAGGEMVEATVGAAGGSLSLYNGGRLEIPQGALAEPTELIFSEGADTRTWNDPERERPVGPMLQLQPGVPVANALEVSIPYPVLPNDFEESDLALAVEVVDNEQRALGTSVQTRWRNYPARRNGSRLTAELSEVPGFRFQFVVSK